MRILHTSDWHLGCTFHGRVLDDVHATLTDYLVEFVAVESADTILVAGDVYDRAIPLNDTAALLDRTLRRLTERTRVALTLGNHGSAHRLGLTVDLMREGLIIRTRTTGLDRGIILPGVDGNEAAIVHALPYLNPDIVCEILPPLLAKRLDEGTPTRHTAGEDQAEDEGAASQPVRSEHPRLPRPYEAVVSAALRLVTVDLDRLRTGHTRHLPSLLMAHAFVIGDEACESERDIRVGGVGSMPSGVFTTLGGLPLAGRSGGFDYVALGHLHRPQGFIRPTGSRLVYSGSPLPPSSDGAEGARSAATKSSVLLDLDVNGVTGLERTPTPVLHQVCILTGTTSEFFSPAFDNAIDAWVCVIFQGEQPPDALATLKECPLSLLAFQHETPTRAIHERIAATAMAGSLRITEDLFNGVCGRTPQPFKHSVLCSAYESALASARSRR